MIFLQHADGRPGMPTTRAGRIRHLLRTHQAEVVSKMPYVVRLAQDTPAYTQGLILGVDPGMTIGLALITPTGSPVWFGEVSTQSEKIASRLADRRMHRQARHRYRRQRQKRRARQAGTTFEGTREVFLPGCTSDGTPYGALSVKEIKPALARFHNRTRPDKWLTPTARHLRQVHVAIVQYLCSLAPVAHIVLEYAAFDIHRLWNSDVEGVAYQYGPQYQAKNLTAYVFARDHYMCQICKKRSTPKTSRVLHAHHLLPRSRGGADRPENMLTLCRECHEALHRQDSKVFALAAKHGSITKQFQATSLVNTIMPSLEKDLQEYAPVQRTYGYITKGLRQDAGLSKTHAHDAYCIAISRTPSAKIDPKAETYPVLYGKQYRQHNRQEITRQPERRYYSPETTPSIAKNRNARTGQMDTSLSEIRKTQVPQYISQLHVKPAHHVKRKPNRYSFRAGDVVRFQGRREIVRGCTGERVYLEGQKKKTFPMSQLTLLKKGGGITWRLSPFP